MRSTSRLWTSWPICARRRLQQRLSWLRLIATICCSILIRLRNRLGKRAWRCAKRENQRELRPVAGRAAIHDSAEKRCSMARRRVEEKREQLARTQGLQLQRWRERLLHAAEGAGGGQSASHYWRAVMPWFAMTRAPSSDAAAQVSKRSALDRTIGKGPDQSEGRRLMDELTNLSYEAAFQELEALVARMESGDLPFGGLGEIVRARSATRGALSGAAGRGRAKDPAGG